MKLAVLGFASPSSAPEPTCACTTAVAPWRRRWSSTAVAAWFVRSRLVPAGRLSVATSWPESMRGTKRSEEHTSELQSREKIVCRLLLEKKKIIFYNNLDANID